MNLRNRPVDKRRLKKEDRGFNTGRAESALAKARQRRGSIAYQRNKPMRTTEQKPGTGGFTQGLSIQQHVYVKSVMIGVGLKALDLKTLVKLYV